jgi:anti-sigma factor RsiW
MKCSQVQSQLSDYLDGQLSPGRTEAVRRHLAACPPCEAAWRGLRRTVRLVAHLGHEKCPVDLRATIGMAVAEAGAPPAAASGLPYGRLAAGASLAALAGAAVFLVAPRAPAALVTAAPPPPLRAAATAELHDQYALTTSLGTTDGLLLSLPGARPRRPAPPPREQQ